MEWMLLSVIGWGDPKKWIRQNHLAKEMMKHVIIAICGTKQALRKCIG